MLGEVVERAELRRSRSAGVALRVLALASVLALVALELGYHLGEERIWRSSEERCNAVVNEMVRSGDWLVPRISPTDAPRLQKPPLFYWAALATAKLAGGPSVVTLRSASLLAGLGLAVTVFLWGRSIGGFACGVASTLSLAAIAMFVTRARYGDAETLLALTTTASLGIFEWLWRTRDRRLIPLLSLGVVLAFLAKGTAGMLTIGVPIGVWLAQHRSLHLVLRPRVLVWAGLSVAAGLAWYLAIVIRLPGVLEEFLTYALQPIGAAHPLDSAVHFRPWFYYLPRFPLQVLPASLLLPWLVRDAWRTRFWRGDPRVRFIATSQVAIFVAWSLVPQKQLHYLLPIVPLYALMCGVFVARRLSLRRDRAFGPRIDHGSDAETGARADSSPRYSQ
jgi:4-amino-4-deoxy-L-arabinose transferase